MQKNLAISSLCKVQPHVKKTRRLVEMLAAHGNHPRSSEAKTGY